MSETKTTNTVEPTLTKNGKIRRPKRASHDVARDRIQGQVASLDDAKIRELLIGMGMPSEVVATCDVSQFGHLLGNTVAETVQEKGIAVSNQTNPLISEAKQIRQRMSRHLRKIKTASRDLADLQEKLDWLKSNQNHADMLFSWADAEVSRLEKLDSAGEPLVATDRPTVPNWNPEPKQDSDSKKDTDSEDTDSE